MRPPFPYYGGKTSLADAIVELLPEHEHYVEPFAGSLAVLLAKRPAAHETANDLNRDLVTFWRVLRERPDELIRVCSLTPHSREELSAAYEPADDELEHARRVWVRLTQGRTARLTPTGWRQRVKPGGASMTRYLVGYCERLAEVAARLANVSLECSPALDVVERFGAHEGVLIYADPPYLIPVLQGWDVDDYHRCAELYASAGVDLTAEPLVGVGSVCRRESTEQIAMVLGTLAERGLRLHGFGVKSGGMSRYGWALTSADSMAWSYNARRNPPLAACSHARCSYCLPFALSWRRRAVERLDMQLPLLLS